MKKRNEHGVFVPTIKSRACLNCKKVFRPYFDHAKFCDYACYHANQTGKKRKTDEEYIKGTTPAGYVTVQDTKKGRHVLEHRKVMSDYLGRALTNKEVVHHKNGIRDDNRLENLELISCQSVHSTRHTTHDPCAGCGTKLNNGGRSKHAGRGFCKTCYQLRFRKGDFD